MITTTPCVPEKVSVTVLKGGDSDEREISLVSGAACAQALREEGFVVTEIDTGETGALKAIIDSHPDVVFIALHGLDGEDGSVQGFCELLKIPYTGSGILASALAMDKTRAKTFYTASGLPTPPSFTLEQGKNFDIDDIVAAVGEKCVVKPAREGSALGVHIIHNPSELPAAIDEAFTHDTLVLVERFIEGRELTVAVLGNEELEALPVIEIIPQKSSAFYDFDAKYSQGGAQHIIPARISEKLTRSCQSIAVDAHKALGCRGVSRSDFIADSSGTCWLLETNTIPGMTPTSLLPDTANHAGIAFGPLCRMLVELAMQR